MMATFAELARASNVHNEGYGSNNDNQSHGNNDDILMAMGSVSSVLLISPKSAVSAYAADYCFYSEIICGSAALHCG